MYWLRVADFSGPLAWLLLSMGWWLGGWLIASHAFELKRDTRLIAGFGIGLAGYLWAAGTLERLMSPALAFTLGVLPVGLLGLALALRRSRPLLSPPGRRSLLLLASGFLLAGLFARLEKGLAPTHDLETLPVISTLAAGQIRPSAVPVPSTVAMRPDGFQVLAASLVLPGGLFPWSALDLSNGIVWSLGILLAFLAARRASTHPLAGPAVAAILVFASGTRYLLLLLPPGTLEEFSLQLLAPDGTATPIPLSEALVGSLAEPGGPPLAYPTAFLNGALPPYAAFHTGAVGLSGSLLLLLWVLAPRADHPLAFLPLASLFALWGATLGAVYLAGFLAWLLLLRRRRGPEDTALRQATRGLALSVPLILLWNGFPAASLTGGPSLRWPAALSAVPFAPLTLNSSAALLVAAFEAGPILLFAPALTRDAWIKVSEGSWFEAWLAAFGWIALGLSLFLDFSNANAALARHALLAWTLLLALRLWRGPAILRSRAPVAEAAALSLMVLGGMVVAGFHLSAGSRAVLAPEIDGLDARVSRDVWGKLPGGVRVLDPKPGRATTLTGLPARRPPPGPTAPGDLLAQGDRFVYVDETWWVSLSGEERSAFSADCVQVLSEHRGPEGRSYRRLLDLSACGSMPGAASPGGIISDAAASGSPAHTLGISAVRLGGCAPPSSADRQECLPGE